MNGMISRTLFTMCAATSLLWQNGAMAASKETVWVLRQSHTDRGLADIYVAPDAIKIVSLRGTYKFVCKAPLWDVRCYNADEKLYWSAPRKDFNGIMLGNPSAQGYKNHQIFKPANTIKIAGQLCTRYKPRYASRTTLDVADNIKTDPRGVDFLCRYWLCPDSGKVPMRFATDRSGAKLPQASMYQVRADFGNDLRHGVVEEVTTVSAKRTDRNKSEFDFPSNFKRTKELTQVVFTIQQKAEMDEIFASDMPFRSRDKKDATTTGSQSSPNSH